MSPHAFGAITEQAPQPEPKGKHRSSPVEIPSSAAESAQPDLFSISLDSHNVPGSSHLGSSSPLATRNDLTASLQKPTSQHDLDAIPYDTDLPFHDKGKARDTPPMLPPLTFPPINFDICPSPSLISEPGPSSYGSLHPQLIEHESFSYTPPVLRGSTTHGTGIGSMFAPSSPRRRSFSIPAPRYPERLVSCIESSQPVNDRPHKHSSDRRQTRSVPNSPGVGVQIPINLDAVDAGSCLAPWMRDFKSRAKDKSKAGSYSYLVLDYVDEGSTTVLPPDFARVRLSSRPIAENRPRKANGRSYSDPYPLPHSFDVVSSYTTDAFVPIPVINPPNLFDGMLPRELRLRIFGFLIQIYEEDHARRVCEGRWTANKAAKHKWVGHDQGVRELMRLRRVSHAIHPLVTFD
jgi:F-box/leucine-rich repeat protein 2/20